MEAIFAGKTALVVGGTGDIGRSIASRLAAAGASVLIHGGHSSSRLEAAVSAASSSVSSRVCGLLRAVSTPQDAIAILPEPCPDILVVAWGPFFRKPLAEMTPADWEVLTLANLAVPGALVSAVLQPMLDRGWGRILLFGGSCTDTIRAFSTTPGYSAAKTALGSLVKSAARASAGSGVTCNLICPGFVDTDSLSSEERQRQAARAPGGRLLSVEDISGISMDIIRKPALNGAIIAADGGLSL